MNINLPKQFVTKMKIMLGTDYDSYLSSFDMPSAKAVHLNTSRLDKAAFENEYSDTFSNLEYADNGYRYDIDEIPKIGQHVLHHAGLLYSQDPGALMTACSMPENFMDMLPASPVVLDMCAAPGGKSSQLAIMLSKNNGFLVSNEIDSARNKILQSNMERMAYKNLIITNYSPEQISSNFPHLFDFIVIDAPCSGEGMFRKYPEAVSEWSENNVALCSERQKDIINNAVNALKPGGYILYSTCTYSKEENEDIINYITSNYDFEIVPLNDTVHKYAVHLNNNPDNPGLHFFPHISYGEGQYMCLLKNKQSLSSSLQAGIQAVRQPNLKATKKEDIALIKDTLKNESFIDDLNLYNIGNYIYHVENLPFMLPSKGVTRPGVCIGSIDKTHYKRFIPDHHLFKVFGNLFNNKADISEDTELAYRYLHGEEIYVDNVPNGYGALIYKGGILGGYKSVNGKLKNHYPKGLRNNN